jgi:hypothetical protein
MRSSLPRYAIGTWIFLNMSFLVYADEPKVCRMGCGPRVAWYARPADSKGDCGYYVGGGRALGGEPRCPTEGTWGWDHPTRLLTRRVALAWSHGRHYQGGTGAYKTDGPKVPDLPALLNPAVYKHHKD